MSVTIRQTVDFSLCRSPYQVRMGDAQLLPQRIQLEQFILKNNITDVGVDDNHELVVAIFNDEYLELEHLLDRIASLSCMAEKFLYLSINKFLIYSTIDTGVVSTADLDLELVNRCYEVVKDKFELVDHTCHSDDSGLLGNFIHPVTNLFLKRYE